MKNIILRTSRDIVFPHQIAAERLIRLYLRGKTLRTDTAYALILEAVGNTCRKRRFGTDDGIFDVHLNGILRDLIDLGLLTEQIILAETRNARIFLCHYRI